MAQHLQAKQVAYLYEEMKDKLASSLAALPAWKQAGYPTVKLASDDPTVIHAYFLPVLCAGVPLVVVPVVPVVLAALKA